MSHRKLGEERYWRRRTQEAEREAAQLRTRLAHAAVLFVELDRHGVARSDVAALHALVATATWPRLRHAVVLRHVSQPWRVIVDCNRTVPTRMVLLAALRAEGFEAVTVAALLQQTSGWREAA